MQGNSLGILLLTNSNLQHPVWWGGGRGVSGGTLCPGTLVCSRCGRLGRLWNGLCSSCGWLGRLWNTQGSSCAGNTAQDFNTNQSWSGKYSFFYMLVYIIIAFCNCWPLLIYNYSVWYKTTPQLKQSRSQMIKKIKIHPVGQIKCRTRARVLSQHLRQGTS